MLTSFYCRKTKLWMRKSCDLWIKSLIKLITSSHFVAFGFRATDARWPFSSFPFRFAQLWLLATSHFSFRTEKVSILLLILVLSRSMQSYQIVYFVRCKYENLSAVATILILFRPVRSQIVARTFHVITLCVACFHSTFTSRCCHLVPCIREVYRKTFHRVSNTWKKKLVKK